MKGQAWPSRQPIATAPSAGEAHMGSYPTTLTASRSRRNARNCIVLCLAMAVSLAILFSVAGAYDTGGLGLDHRLILWTTIKLLVVLQAILFRALFLRAMRDGWLAQGLAAIGAMLATNVAAGFQIHGMKLIGLLPKEPDPILGFILFLSPAVLPVAGLTVLIWILFDHRSDDRQAAGKAGPVDRSTDTMAAQPATPMSSWP
ncbi:MAG: hypothetical protein AAGA94_13260, partial [Pseudomonadota bacterium]